MKIIRIPLKSLHNEEWHELNVIFKSKILHYGPEALGVQRVWGRYLLHYATSDKLLQITHKSTLTDEVVEADKKRDEVFQGFYAVVKGSQKQPNEDKLKAARRLFVVLKEYQKSILYSTYNEESGALRNLLQDLSGTYAADVALLGFTDWATSLEQAERDFLALYGERQDESVAKPKEDLQLIRAEMESLYVAIINILDAILQGDGLGGDTVVDPESLKDGVYESDTPSHLRGNVVYNFVLDWNETLKKYHNIIQQRAGRRSKNKNEAED
jgi:hypothetical protein